MINSATANKILKQSSDERARIVNFESSNCTYSYGKDECYENPNNYKFSNTNEKIVMLDNDILKLKHAINVFNVTTKVPGKDITVDMALVALPLLQNRKHTLESMISKDNVSRRILSTGVVEYTEIAYDKKEVELELQAVNKEIIDLQNGIDYVNLTVEFTNPLER